MNELEKSLEALRQSTPENALQNAFNMFDAIHKGLTTEDGFRLLAFYNTIGFAQANGQFDLNATTKKAISELKDTIVIQILTIAHATAYKGIKGWYCNTPFQYAVYKNGLEDYDFSDSDPE